ncbi:MAG: hypothetical protein M5U14_13635 [Acidimicrobiia bacterium]|nr:hypothetical protein [Acidimicrobiia bacterium]
MTPGASRWRVTSRSPRSRGGPDGSRRPAWSGAGRSSGASTPDLARFGLTKYWNLYVLRRPDVAEPTVPARRPEELAERERLWKLDTRVADPEDLEALRAVLGETGATG